MNCLSPIHTKPLIGIPAFPSENECWNNSFEPFTFKSSKAVSNPNAKDGYADKSIDSGATPSFNN